MVVFNLHFMYVFGMVIINFIQCFLDYLDTLSQKINLEKCIAM